jgi:hypothetical protein
MSSMTYHFKEKMSSCLGDFEGIGTWDFLSFDERRGRGQRAACLIVML